MMTSDRTPDCGEIVGQWAIILLLGAAAVLSNHWLGYLVAMFFIAGRQHALAVLGHEGAHYRLSRNRQVNEILADVFCMLPLIFCFRRWQHEHIEHHKFINTEADPYLSDFRQFSIWHWPKSRRQAWLTIGRMLAGLEVRAVILPGKRWSVFGDTPALNPAEKIRALLFYSSLLIALGLTQGWWVFLLLWIVPMMTWTFVFLYWRTVAEHRGLGLVEDIEGTRHVDANWLERLTIAPLGINYHMDHHLFPSVPYYNLPRLHERLLQEPVYRKHVIRKDGYFGRNSVYEEVVTNKELAILT